MLNIEDLWIGDLIRLKKSGRIGKFDGRSGHKKVRIKVGDKIVITPLTNIEMAPEGSEVAPNIISNRPILQKKTTTNLSDTIDLHIEKLNSSLLNGRPERILDTQVRAAKTFIKDSIQNGTKKILIIHGKGEGVLKSEITHLLSLNEKVQFVFDKNDGGATEVWFY